MSLQQTWIGNLRPNHDYPQHVWVAALRKAPAGVRGKELIIWDNGWETKKEELIRKKKKPSQSSPLPCWPHGHQGNVELYIEVSSGVSSITLVDVCTYLTGMRLA